MPSPESCLLKRIETQEIAAQQFGFYWEHFDQIMAQIHSECIEVDEAWQRKDRSHLQEEIGDLLQAVVSLAVFCKLDPHETLLNSIEKFQKRYNIVVEAAHQDGLANLHQQPFEVLMRYWNLAKE